LSERPWKDFDVSPDGSRFLAIVPKIVANELPLDVVVKLDLRDPQVTETTGAGGEYHIYGSNDIVSHMKTTVEISGGLLDEARRVAARERTTVRALIEAGLRREVEQRRRGGRFRMRRVTFRGRGLRPELAGAAWDRIRDLAYEGRD